MKHGFNCASAMAMAIALLAPASAADKDRVQWRSGTITHAQYRSQADSVGLPTAASGSSVSTVRGEFDFEADDAVFTAEERVARNMRLPLAEGDKVQFAIEKGRLLLKLPDGKIRKLKLLGTYKKSNSRGLFKRN